MSGRRDWSTVSLHREYIEAKLPELKRQHKCSFTSIVETLIDRALEDPTLLISPSVLEHLAGRSQEDPDADNSDS